MARPKVDNNKYIAVLGLREWDLIQLTSGEKVTFVRCKQKDFLGIMEDGKRYSIFINKFDKVLGQGNITQSVIEPKPKYNQPTDKENQVRQLRRGTKVKLTNGDIAELVKINQKRFVGTIRGKEYTIPFGMFVSVIEEATSTSKTEDNFIIVKCTCEHLGVPNGTKGIIKTLIEGGFAAVVKWSNGITEKIEWDLVEII